ncbi:MAG: glycosyltransferase, partial [Gammaproteobacteria bacterium]|nr:glycosyltransferase [Gammaproteobacteria bacterium]
MKILHVLDHSIPLQSGYTFRSRSILEHQRAMGWETVHLTSAKHQVDPPPPPLEEVDGLSFYRTPLITSMEKIPVANQLGIVRSLEKRLAEVVAIEKPDLIHAHSPCLNGVAALRVGRRAKLPVVYECRAFWEDAAVDHGTSS